MQKSVNLTPNTLSEFSINESNLLAVRENLADDELSGYGFGKNVTVVGQGSWDRNDKNDFTKIVYVKFDDVPSDTSKKVSFHVQFNESTHGIEVQEAYGLLMSNGDYIGQAQEKKNAL